MNEEKIPYKKEGQALKVQEFVTRLCESSRVSGFESSGAAVVRAAFSEMLDDVSVDTFGSVVGVKKGRGKGSLMFAAHLDEIGMMVTTIGEKGFVRFTTVGGIDSRVLVAQEVTIHGRQPVYGVIGIKPPHITQPGDEKKAVKINDLTIDTGFPAERVKELVRPGDIITFNTKAAELKNGQLTVKSLDDAAGVAALYAAMGFLKDYNHDLDVYFVATAQEEIGGNGALVSAYGIEPDIAVAIDVGFGKTPELEEIRVIEMGKGPAVAIGPGIHTGVYETFINTAKTSGVPYQVEVLPSGTGTDADELQVSRAGVASGVISIPLKFMHTPVETVTVEDIKQTGRLLAAFAAAFNGKELEDALCL
jgi:endoglucanase